MGDTTNYVYDARKIKEVVSCEAFLRRREITIRGNRFNATWRGGDSFSCSFQGALFFDHKDNSGGSVIDLCMKVDGLSHALLAIKKLGDEFHVEPISIKREAEKKTRADRLVADGWKRTATYTYENEQSEAVYFVDRYEREKNGKKEKTFNQRTNAGESIEGVERLLYNLPAVIKSERVFIVEGEKDVETLRSLNLVGTTNSGGGKYWSESFNHYFQGKTVIILPDNDETGQGHASMIYSLIKPIAKSVKVVTISALAKGDVTDWIEREGGTVEKLEDAVRNHQGEIKADAPEVAMAKVANATPFKNYITHKDGEKTTYLPVLIDKLVEDINIRFLNYPRRIGSRLFDWIRDEKRIMEIDNKNALFAWMQGCSKHEIKWRSGVGLVSRDELFARVYQTAKTYSGVSAAPHFPKREDIFYTHEPLPKEVDQTHDTFWRLVDFFSLASEVDKTLFAAFLCAPAFYNGKDPRPAWIVDTVNAQGSGKSTVVEMCAYLYNEVPLDLDLKTLGNDSTVLVKRVLSAEGRSKRIAMIDNATGQIAGGVLAKLVTMQSISGMAPYGHGEESRPNDITWTCTVNGANFDSDMASRSYTIRVKKPDYYDPMFKTNVMEFIDRNRMRIFSDIRDMMEHAPLRRRSNSRFGMFDSRVVSAVCRTDEEFKAVDNLISGVSEENNEDYERGQAFEEMIRQAICTYSEHDMGGLSANYPIFFRTRDIELLLHRSSGMTHKMSIGEVRSLLKMGALKNWSKKVSMSPGVRDSKYPRCRGMLWGLDRIYESPDSVNCPNGKAYVQLTSVMANGIPHLDEGVVVNRDSLV